MHTIRDVVIEQAEALPVTAATMEGLQLLHLEHKEQNYSAANLYIESLKLIQELRGAVASPKAAPEEPSEPK